MSSAETNAAFSPLRFDVAEDGSEGVFVWGEERDALFERFDGVLDGIDRSASDADDALLRDLFGDAGLEDVLREDPEFIDGYNHLAARRWRDGDIQEALRLYGRATAIGQRLIPDSFRGEIIWGYLSNRPFLRALHGRATCLRQLGEYAEAARDFLDLLRYNPNDNQGIRYMLGPLLMEAGDWEGAYAHQAELMGKEDQVHDAVECYDFSLTRLALGDLTGSIMFLRRAMAKNVYVAEVLLAKTPLVPYEIEHLGTETRLEDAVEYVMDRGRLWREDVPLAIPLLIYLRSHETVRDDLDAVYALRHRLLHTPAADPVSNTITLERVNARRQLSDEIAGCLEDMDETSSARIATSAEGWLEAYKRKTASHPS